MGAYYIFVAYFTFFATLSAVELSVPYSRKFRKVRSQRCERVIFDGFLTTVFIVAFVIAAPATIVFSMVLDLNWGLMPVVYFCLVLEAAANELVRFFWNIGDTKAASSRDLFRSLVFVLAIIGSIVSVEKIVTTGSLLGLAVGNFLLLAVDHSARGRPRVIQLPKLISITKRTVQRLINIFPSTLTQFTQMQLIGLQVIAERVLISKFAGLPAVAAFGFVSAILQSGGGLLLMPLAARVRSLAFQARKPKDRIEARNLAVNFLYKASALTFVLLFLVRFAWSVVSQFGDISASVDYLLLVASFSSSVSGVYCGAISALFAFSWHGRAANYFAISVTSVLFLAGYFAVFPLPPNTAYVLVITAGIVSIATRVALLKSTL
jgi:hypothetical protein